MRTMIVAAALLGLFGASTAMASEPLSTSAPVRIENVRWGYGYGGYGYGYRPYRWGGYYRPYGYGYGFRPYRAYYGGFAPYRSYGGWGGGYYPYGGGYYAGFGVF